MRARAHIRSMRMPRPYPSLVHRGADTCTAAAIAAAVCAQLLTNVLVATFGSERMDCITVPMAESISCVASPIGPRADWPQDAALQELGV